METKSNSSFVLTEDQAMAEFMKSLTYAIGLVDAQAASNQAPRTYALIRRHADVLRWGREHLSHD